MDMAKVSQLFSPKNPSVEVDLDEQKARLIRTLLDTLSVQARSALVKELAIEAANLADNTPTGVLATVLKLLPPGQTVTAAELRQQVEERGIEAQPKEIYNAIGYLARAGALKRTGYGRYMINGMEISTSDELGGERDRHEDVSDGD